MDTEAQTYTRYLDALQLCVLVQLLVDIVVDALMVIQEVSVVVFDDYY